MRRKPAPRPAPFQIHGEIDLSNAGELARQLEQYAATTTGDLVVDCHDMTFIDSSGLHALVRLQQRLTEMGRRIVLERLQANCGRVFELGGLDHYFNLQTA